MECKGGGIGISPRKPASQRHRPARFSRASPPGIEPGSPWWEASALAATFPRPRRSIRAQNPATPARAPSQFCVPSGMHFRTTVVQPGISRLEKGMRVEPLRLRSGLIIIMDECIAAKQGCSAMAAIVAMCTPRKNYAPTVVIVANRWQHSCLRSTPEEIATGRVGLRATMKKARLWEPLARANGYQVKNYLPRTPSQFLALPPAHVYRLFARYGGNTARLALRSDEALGVRVSVAHIAPSLLHLGRVAFPITCSLVRGSRDFTSMQQPMENQRRLEYIHRCETGPRVFDGVFQFPDSSGTAAAGVPTGPAGDRLLTRQGSAQAIVVFGHGGGSPMGDPCRVQSGVVQLEYRTCNTGQK
ncbi:hypothetical protein PR048_025992 [Dryococelus australis]|uniref:Uncharacterized protein n=1 Tax=Dryococelus australis TaxID=614101 RepID=A0ABQ9GK31_9NEOP|nr:hypothetical protein PR048_025992 [Dryococelus australis]